MWLPTLLFKCNITFTGMVHNRYKCIVLTVIALLLMSACEKENSTSFADLIIGKWEWVESVSPWTGLVTNPSTEGYSNTLEFSAEGRMKTYRNDTLMNSTNYRIEQYSTEPDRYDIIYGPDLRADISLVKDSLFLNSAFVDGPVSSYVRIE